MGRLLEPWRGLFTFRGVLPVEVGLMKVFISHIAEEVALASVLKPESTEGRPWGQPLKKPAGAPLNLG